MKNTPPSGDRVVCVDFDGTIAPWGALFGMPDPFPGVVAAMLALKAASFRIVIFTSRLSPRWAEADAPNFGYTSAGRFTQANLQYVIAYLTQHGIPFDEVTAEKVPAAAYFDDHAVLVRGRGRGGLADGIRHFLAGQPT